MLVGKVRAGEGEVRALQRCCHRLPVWPRSACRRDLTVVMGQVGVMRKKEKDGFPQCPMLGEFSATKWGRNGLREVRAHRFSASVIYESLRNAQILLQYSSMKMEQGPL